MRVLVCGASPEADGEAYYRRLLAKASYVIAADAGAEWAVRLGRTPDVAVGDFDSAVPAAQERLTQLGVEVVEFPTAKDASDLDLAIAEARCRKATGVTLTAVSTRRLDHTLAALGALVSAADLDADLDEPSLAAWPLDAQVRPSLSVEGPTGALVSVLAFGGPADGVTLAGMRFPLANAHLDPFSSHGLSNELAAPTATITVGRGRLIVLAPGPPAGRARAAGDS